MTRLLTTAAALAVMTTLSTPALAQSADGAHQYPMAKTYSTQSEAMSAAGSPIEVEIFAAPIPAADNNVYTAGTSTYQSKTYGQTYTSQPYVSQPYTIEVAQPQMAETATYSYPIAVTQIAPLSTNSGAHVVAQGDTLYSIGRRHGLKPSQIMSANGLSGSAISIGQVLNLPGATTTMVEALPTYAQPVTSASTQVIRNVTPLPAGNNVYAVLPGDTLYSIARRSCVSVADIATYSGITQAGVLSPGQRLTLPSGHCAK